ncbi:MAG TPA: NADH-quinone oxidoreductase subunit NuoF [Spirochaetota bacterium]|nr:NADH-quinone oxidoreductase subunit NuoF [Spirochaetota bacterium]
MMIQVQEIKNVVDKWGNDSENLMLIMRELETRSGSNQVDKDTLKSLAEVMNIPESTVSGFVDFYTMFKKHPRGKFLIRVSKSGPDHVMGARDVFDFIEEYLGIKPGETTADGMFHLEACECLGVSSVAPAMMVNYDIHGNLNRERLKKIFDDYKKKEPSFKSDCGPETYADACIIDNAKQTKRLLEAIGKVKPESVDSYVQNGGYEGLKKTLKECKPEDVVAVVKDSGLRGRGGAGFPAGMKWSFVTKGDMQKYVICNADEGEPGTFKDRILMEGNPHAVIEGMAICGYAIDASIGYIYVRGEFRKSIELLQNAIDQAREKGILGKNIFGSGFDFDLFIKEGGGAYVCGEETSLINSMEGARGYPRFKPPFPGGAGFKNLPSNVNNVETFASVPMIMVQGADWYKEMGPTNCSGTKLYCLSGKMNNTGLIEMPMGTTLKEIINDFGGGMKDGKKFKFAHVGGSAGGILGEDLMDLPLDIDQTTKAGVTLGSGVVLVADEDTCAVDYLLQIMSFFEHESCGQCVPCRVGTSQLHHILKKFATRTAKKEDLDVLVEKATLMQKASLCALGQSPILPIKTMLKYFKDEFIRHCDPEYSCPECDRSLKRYYSGAGH